MKRILYVLAVPLVLVTALAQLPTPSALSIMANTNGLVIAPTNFWTANQDYIQAPQQANTIVVDAINGSDSTGARGTARPFATLAAALAAMQSGDTMLLRGTHYVAAQYYGNDSDAITLTHGLVNLSNVTLYGPGATILATNYGNILTIQNCSNVVIDGITFRSTVTTTNEIGTNNIAAAINHRQTNYLTTIRNCQFINIPDQAISHCWPTYGRPSYNWTITGCYFEDIGTIDHPAVGQPDGAMVSGRPRNLIFSGNRSDGLNAYGVELDGGGTGAPGSDTFGNASITGNVLRGMYRHGVLLVGIATNGIVDGATVTGNQIEFHSTGGGSCVLAGSARNLLVAGNIFRGGVTADAPSATRRYGVNMTLTYGGEATWSNIVVVANTFIGMTYGASCQFNESIASKIFGVHIANNTFIDQGEGHLTVSGGGVSVLDNMFFGCGRTGSPTYPYAIYAYDMPAAPFTNAVIRGNILNDLATTATTTKLFYMVTGNGTNATPKNLQFEANEALRMAGAAPLTIPGGVTSRTTQTVGAYTQLIPWQSEWRIVGLTAPTVTTNLPSIISGIDGQTLRLIGTSDSYTVTYQDDGTLTGSGLSLGSTTRVLGLGDVLQLRFDGYNQKWQEIGFNNN